MARYQSPEQEKLNDEALRLQIKVIEETQMVGRIIEQMKELLKKGKKNEM